MSFVSKTQKEKNEKENKKVKFKNCDINKNKMIIIKNKK